MYWLVVEHFHKSHVFCERNFSQASCSVTVAGGLQWTDISAQHNVPAVDVEEVSLFVIES